MDDVLDRSAANVHASLVGSWRGRGTISLPSMAPRDYDEEVRFAVRSPVSLDYWQRAIDAVDGSMLHSEAGIWRVAAADTVELSIALPGATEVSEGVLDGDSIVVASTKVGRAATGARLVRTARRYEVRGDTMSVEIAIATEAFPIVGHIRGELTRSICARLPARNACVPPDRLGVILAAPGRVGRSARCRFRR